MNISKLEDSHNTSSPFFTQLYTYHYNIFTKQSLYSVMATLHLSSIVIGLIFTIINALVELAFVNAMLVTLALYECNILKKGKLINIRRHCVNVKVITWIGMMIFISVEIGFSATTKNGSRSVTVGEPCIRMRINIPPKIPSGNFSNEDTLITYKCLDSTNDTFRVRLGNYSTKTGKVECSADEVFSYQVNTGLKEFPIDSGIDQYAEVTEDLGKVCITARAEGRMVYFSEPYREIEVTETAFTGNLSFFGTKLSFDPQPHLEDFAESVAWLFVNSVTESLDLRRAIFLRPENATCPSQIEATIIPNLFIVIMLELWMFSLILFGVGIYQRQYVFYDLRNAWDCTTKISYRFHDSGKGEFYVKCIERSGDRRIYITDNSEEDTICLEDELDGFSDSEEDEKIAYCDI